MTLGFNKGGHIFLNLASFLKGDQAAVSQWGVVIMHELAHNNVSGHGKEFIQALQDIVAFALDNMNERLQQRARA